MPTLSDHSPRHINPKNSMKIFQKTRKVAKKKSTQPKRPQQEVYARAAAPSVGKQKKRKRPDDEGLALGPLTARQRRCVAAAP